MMKEKEQSEMLSVIEFVESLARVTDKALVDAVYEKEINADEYISALQHIAEYTENQDYGRALDLMKQLTSLLDGDAKIIVEYLEDIHENAPVIFLDYFYEYILDYYEFEKIFNEMHDEIGEDSETAGRYLLEEAYSIIKRMLDCEVIKNGRCKSDCNM